LARADHLRGDVERRGALDRGEAPRLDVHGVLGLERLDGLQPHAVLQQRRTALARAVPLVLLPGALEALARLLGPLVCVNRAVEAREWSGAVVKQLASLHARYCTLA